MQGDKSNKGELFGLQNLFSFQENTILKEIVNKTNVAESKAGVAVAGLELEDWEDEEFEEDVNGENALNQLAAIVAGEKSALENSRFLESSFFLVLYFGLCSNDLQRRRPRILSRQSLRKPGSHILMRIQRSLVHLKSKPKSASGQREHRKMQIWETE